MTNSFEISYLSLVEEILANGVKKNDRTGVGTIGLINKTLEVDLRNNILPILTHRKINYKNAIEEFLFMWRGHTNTKLLEGVGVNIWKGNTSREFLDKKGLQHFPEGEMGRMYGYNLRNFNGYYDQLNYVINEIKTNPDSRRICMTTQDVSKRDFSVLDCCHGVWCQFYVNTNINEISLMMTQRSCDLVLGNSTNVIFYAIMLNMVAKITGYKPFKLYMNLNDVHIYKNHVDKVREILTQYYNDKRFIYDSPTFSLKKDVNSIEDVESLCFDDFIINDYRFDKFVKFEMAI